MTFKKVTPTVYSFSLVLAMLAPALAEQTVSAEALAARAANPGAVVCEDAKGNVIFEGEGKDISKFLRSAAAQSKGMDARTPTTDIENKPEQDLIIYRFASSGVTCFSITV